jgi:hypothetical protein
MRKLRSAIVLLAGLTLLGACQSVSDDDLKIDVPPPGSKEAEIQTLQKATALAQGELAWEIVQISDIQRDPTSVKWVATTRSLHLHCTADPDGGGSFCTPDSAAAPAS